MTVTLVSILAIYLSKFCNTWKYLTVNTTSSKDYRSLQKCNLTPSGAQPSPLLNLYETLKTEFRYNSEMILQKGTSNNVRPMQARIHIKHNYEQYCSS